MNYAPRFEEPKQEKWFEVRYDGDRNPVLFYRGQPASSFKRTPLPGDQLCMVDWVRGRQRIRKLRPDEASLLSPGRWWGVWAAAEISETGRAALDYARNGIPVFPCKAKDKSPWTKNGFKGATTDLAKITALWKKWPDALIGMPTGKVSGIAVLDLDKKEGRDGLAAVPGWEARSSVIARTRSGGVHLYFANDDRVRTQSDQIAPGIDTRGNGGYVIVPPSAGYEFFKGDLNSIIDRSALQPWPDDMRPRERERAEPPPSSDAKISEREKAKIIAALNVISSDGYQVWFEIGSALHNALGAGGFDLFDKWSAKSPKYDKHKCLKQWDACATTMEFGIGTIFHYADEAAPNWRAEFDEKHPKQLILTSSEFVAGFIPPDYLIDGILQRRFLYSITAPTGTGKTAIMLRLAAHVALGVSLGDREIVAGKMLFFAGENPDDIRTRWIKLCEEMKIDPATTEVFFVAGVVPLSKVRKRIEAEAKIHGPFALVIVDTFAAYFEGDDENSNTQMGNAARMLRSLAQVEGGPTVIVTCHPTKTPNQDNLLPRGGGAFLAEVDGNLVCLKQDGFIVDLHWQGKFRGPDFAPIAFKIESGTTDLLKDRKGRSIWTVTARPISAQEREAVEDAAHRRQGELLAAMRNHAGLSLAGLAKALGWTNKNGEPNKGLVNRAMTGLAGRGLVKKGEGGNWTVTAAGKKYVPSDDWI